MFEGRRTNRAPIGVWSDGRWRRNSPRRRYVKKSREIAAVLECSSQSGGLVRRGDKKNLEPVIELAVEIAREGREGRGVGTLFTFGDADAVLKHSRPLILDPLAGHREEARHLRDLNLRGTIKGAGATRWSTNHNLARDRNLR
jgi:hypothetical protein